MAIALFLSIAASDLAVIRALQGWVCVNREMFGCMHKDCMDEAIKMNYIARKMILIVFVILLITCTAAGDKAEIDPDADVNVTVNAPEYVSEDTFEVTLDVTKLIDLYNGQFDLTYDPDVLKVPNKAAESGNIDDTEIPITGERHFKDGDYDRYRVLFRLNGADCVCGSGYLAKITFEVVGETGDTSIIDVITDPDEGAEPILGDCIGAQQASGLTSEITANWFGTNVTVGTAPPGSAGTPTPTPTVTPAVNATPELESTLSSSPTPTATPIETESLELSPNPFAMTASAESAPAAAVPDASSKGNGLLNIPTSRDLIPIYSLVGLLALIYTLTQFR